MEIIIRGKNLDVPDTARDYIRHKVAKLERHFPSGEVAQVEVAREKTRVSDVQYLVQITVDSRGTLLRGQEKGLSIEAACDAAVNVLDRRIERFKSKAYRSLRRAPSGKEPAGTGEMDETGLSLSVKRFNIKPMSPEEAVEQMELLGHDFFLFLNAESNRYSVVYRRREGRYGMIESQAS